MLTTNERLDKLETTVIELRAALQIAGALPVFAVQAVLDQMVDEQLLAASTRTEIFGRIRKELSVVSVGSAEIARGARNAIPYYQTKAEADEVKHRRLQLQKEHEKIEREILRPRTSALPNDQ